MTQVELFAQLLIIESLVHAIKGYQLLNDSHQMQIARIKQIKMIIEKIEDEVISGDDTKLYLAR